jgi:putative radical SAM enzyme (TIGR03279 family)
MPPGMRETLYFKDDDSRLSFLQGNYITLTNMNMQDMERIIRYHLAPINISVHTTNPELRCQMLHNRFAGDILEKIRMFSEEHIEMNSQVVLCRGINDGEELDRTIRDLSTFYPAMESLSVVPVGLTRFREGLPRLEAFDRESARQVIRQIKDWQNKLKESLGSCFVHASDEWFILAGEEIPPADYYEGFGQLENGVGMVRLLIEEVRETLGTLTGDDRHRQVSIATAKKATKMRPLSTWQSTFLPVILKFLSPKSSSRAVRLSSTIIQTTMGIITTTITPTLYSIMVEQSSTLTARETPS